eukprot:UN3091
MPGANPAASPKHTIRDGSINRHAGVHRRDFLIVCRVQEEVDNNLTQDTGHTKITPSAQLNLDIGNISWSSTADAVAPVLEDPI